MFQCTIHSICQIWKEYSTTGNLPKHDRQVYFTGARMAGIGEAAKRPRITVEELQRPIAQVEQLSQSMEHQPCTPQPSPFGECHESSEGHSRLASEEALACENQNWAFDSDVGGQKLHKRLNITLKSPMKQFGGVIMSW